MEKIEYMTVKEIAELLEVKPATVRLWIKKRVLFASKNDTGHYQIRRMDFIRFASDNHKYSTILEKKMFTVNLSEFLALSIENVLRGSAMAFAQSEKGKDITSRVIKRFKERRKQESEQ